MNPGKTVAATPRPDLDDAVSSDKIVTESIVTAEAVLDFGRKWSPYGGGPAEDIMVEFGWSSDRFFTEFENLLATAPPRELPPHVVVAMIEVCRRRIWMGQ